jgi:hypothetical protein
MALCRGEGERYIGRVPGYFLRRLIILSTAMAFVLAMALPSAAPAMAMTAKAQMPCANCPDKAPNGTGQPGGDLAKMTCSALACAGVAVALPARQMSYLPAFTKLSYPPVFGQAIVGARPTPEPYPPRPIVRG